MVLAPIDLLKRLTDVRHVSLLTLQGSASECVLVSMLVARHAAIKELKNNFPFVDEGVLLSRLVAYCSKLVSFLFYSLAKSSCHSEEVTITIMSVA